MAGSEHGVLLSAEKKTSKPWWTGVVRQALVPPALFF
jgi:hypothetical protein